MSEPGRNRRECILTRNSPLCTNKEVLSQWRHNEYVMPVSKGYKIMAKVFVHRWMDGRGYSNKHALHNNNVVGDIIGMVTINR